MSLFCVDAYLSWTVGQYYMINIFLDLIFNICENNLDLARTHCPSKVQRHNYCENSKLTTGVNVSSNGCLSYMCHTSLSGKLR